jgi:photosystem II stability/assembly factor-like uncharacterized protein
VKIGIDPNSEVSLLTHNGNMTSSNALKVFFRICLLALLVGGTTGHAQWTRISSIGAGVRSFGVLTYKDGLLWGAVNQVMLSTDKGTTWQSRTVGNNLSVYAMDFFDQQTGAVVTSNNQVYLTQDQGLTWKVILAPGVITSAVRFGRTASDIYVGTENYRFFVSRDGGATWASQNLSMWIADFAKLADGSMTLVTSNPVAENGSLYTSSDQGTTWIATPGIIGGDIWSYASSICNDGCIYVVNEQIAGASRQQSLLWATTNRGQTWKKALTMNTMDMRGCVAVTQQCVYVPTRGSGVLRSLDSGQSWKSIGGPTCNFDSRAITAISDNELFITDVNGDVWHTTNSGGFPVPTPRAIGSILLSTTSPFAGDTVDRCHTISKRIQLTAYSCRNARIDSLRISGSDAADYVITYQPTAEFGTLDSLTIRFTPEADRTHNASLVLYMQNGETHTVNLQVAVAKNNIFSVAGASVATVIIGGNVDVPIYTNYIGAKPSFDLLVSYDTTVLIYDGATLVSTQRVQEIGSSKPGRVHLHFDAAELSIARLAGTLHFRAFPISSNLTAVTFDSLGTNAPTTACTLSVPNDTSWITMPIGCGTPTLSKFLRYDELPTFSLMPNPSNGNVGLTSSADIGDVRITISNALGATLFSSIATLRAGETSILVTSHLPAGAYLVRVDSGVIRKTIRMMRLH